LDPGGKFCPDCGSKYPLEVTTAELKQCINCGAELGPEDTYCPKCGSSQTPSVTAASDKWNALPKIGSDIIEEVKQANELQLLLLPNVLVPILGFILWFYYKGKDKSELAKSHLETGFMCMCFSLTFNLGVGGILGVALTIISGFLYIYKFQWHKIENLVETGKA